MVVGKSKGGERDGRGGDGIRFRCVVGGGRRKRCSLTRKKYWQKNSITTRIYWRHKQKLNNDVKEEKARELVTSEPSAGKRRQKNDLTSN